MAGKRRQAFHHRPMPVVNGQYRQLSHGQHRELSSEPASLPLPLPLAVQTTRLPSILFSLPLTLSPPPLVLSRVAAGGGGG